MEKKKEMNIVWAVLICLALAGVLVFISVNNKVNMDTSNDLGRGTNTIAGEAAKNGDMAA
ncbi:hypothetical protein HYW73_03905 [Candidatus Nomurabacteria bacterium]|nr:hypothetical protein [Candidatus Nomurabacteria bacterium]